MIARPAGKGDAIAGMRTAAISKSANPEQTVQNHPTRLAGRVRQLCQGLSSGKARRLIETGKVFVDGAVETDPGRPVLAHQQVRIVPTAPRPTTRSRLTSDVVAYVDDQVVVVRKPAGVSTVPYEPGERGTLHELVRAWLNRTRARRKDRATGDLGIVHRLDKETSGLVVFARTLLAKRHLAQQFRFHTVERRYLAIAHGQLSRRTFRSRLVTDRGDGLRGSTEIPSAGLEAITEIEPLELLRGATLASCTLRTGRTHQIRIHLSEAGHPVVGERVYVRGYEGRRIAAPRLMLHAAVLGFEHPVRGEWLRFEETMPEDMQNLIRELSPERAP